MSELTPISPLMDGLEIGECFSDTGKAACYYLERHEPQEQLVLKHISLPESETRTEALILTGAVADAAGAQAYYEDITNSISHEVKTLQALSAQGAVAPWSGYQIVRREKLGFDVYLLMPRRTSLRSILAQGSMTQLQALNLGIDLCNALETLREAGLAFLNLKPENIFVDALGRYTIGDLGLMPMQDLRYCAVPEEYRSDFSAPELSKLIAEPSETSDLYSLGMILYYIFNDRYLPFEGAGCDRAKAKRQRERGDILPTPACADADLAEILVKACQADPNRRWETPAALRQALMLYMQRTEVSDQPLVPPISALPAEPVEEAAPEDPLPTAPALPQEEPAIAEAMEALLVAQALEGIAEEPAPEVAPPVEDKKISIDDLLTSVTDVLSEVELAPTAAPDFEANETMLAEAAPKKRRNKRWLVITAIVLALGCLGAAVFYFYSNWYLVTMDRLEVTEQTDSSLTIAYQLSTPDPALTWDCMDTYGNSFPGTSGEKGIVFSGLTPGTQYTVSFHAGKLHKLLGTTSIAAATAVQTQIVSMAVEAGGSATTAVVNLVVSGAEPTQWTLAYSSTDGDSGSVNFTGHSVTISDLQLHQEYTFTLQLSEGYYPTGETSCTYKTVAAVAVSDLTVIAATEASLSVSWESLGDAPLSWAVTCSGKNYEKTVETSVCAATFYDIDLDTAYTFTLSADGMAEPLTVNLPANAPIITSLEAQEAESRAIEVHWSCSETPPADGWRVRYLVGGDEALCGTVNVPEGNSALLRGLPPNSEVLIFLETANGSGLIGTNSVTITTAQTIDYMAHGYSIDSSALHFYALPAQQDWGYADLTDAKEGFDAGADVAVALEYSGTLQLSETGETAILLVLRSEKGKVISFRNTTANWNEMWDDQHYCTSLTLPSESGSYQVELYFDSQTAAKEVLTVNNSTVQAAPANG